MNNLKIEDVSKIFGEEREYLIPQIQKMCIIDSVITIIILIITLLIAWYVIKLLKKENKDMGGGIDLLDYPGHCSIIVISGLISLFLFTLLLCSIAGIFFPESYMIAQLLSMV